MFHSWIQAALGTSLGFGLAFSSNFVQAAIYDQNGNKLPDAEVNSPKVNWQLLKAQENQKYNGIGMLEVANQPFCTAFLINTAGQLQAAAYALTNGHCYDPSAGLPGNNEIVLNHPSDMVFHLSHFVDSKRRDRAVPVRRVVYATMKSTDIAILELNITFKQLVQQGFTPLTLASKTAQIGEPVEVIGVPITDVNPALQFLHQAVCKIGQSVNLREASYHWENSIRNHCSVVGGMSGSPMISLKSNQVVGIINTGVDDQALTQPACSLNRPCEVNNDKITTLVKENYAQLISKIPGCFNQNGIFNLSSISCQLEKP
jgi:V8-like Glu-specific endopeptidase